jgi:hypothetical protein
MRHRSDGLPSQLTGGELRYLKRILLVGRLPPGAVQFSPKLCFGWKIESPASTHVERDYISDL